MHDLHLQAENYTEAGFTLKLYANMLSWGESITCAPNDTVGQPEWQRKEQLYHEVVHCIIVRLKYEPYLIILFLSLDSKIFR